MTECKQTFQSIWYHTDLPKNVIDCLTFECEKNYEEFMSESLLHSNIQSDKIRKSKNSWIPTTHWIAGFVWHYIEKANRENFLYDIRNIDGETIQYTKYEQGDFYGWHQDYSLQSLVSPSTMMTSNNSDEEIIGMGNDYISKNVQCVRKLSFVIQLSEHNEYEGGNLQIMNESNKPYFAPRKRGSIIIFDSRSPHRVLKVTKGTRKSLVGWVVGPRWK